MLVYGTRERNAALIVKNKLLKRQFGRLIIIFVGVLIAFLLRYDAHRAGRKINFAKPYFQTTFIAYVIGLFTTMFVMHTFKAAQVNVQFKITSCL